MEELRETRNGKRMKSLGRNDRRDPSSLPFPSCREARARVAPSAAYFQMNCPGRSSPALKCSMTPCAPFSESHGRLWTPFRIYKSIRKRRSGLRAFGGGNLVDSKNFFFRDLLRIYRTRLEISFVLAPRHDTIRELI